MTGVIPVSSQTLLIPPLPSSHEQNAVRYSIFCVLPFCSPLHFISSPFPLYSHSLDIPPIESRRLVYLHLAVVRRISFSFLSSHSSFFPPSFFFSFSFPIPSTWKPMAVPFPYCHLHVSYCSLSLYKSIVALLPLSIVLDKNISISSLPFHLRLFPKRFLPVLLSLLLFTFDRVHFPLKLRGWPVWCGDGIHVFYSMPLMGRVT